MRHALFPILGLVGLLLALQACASPEVTPAARSIDAFLLDTADLPDHNLREVQRLGQRETRDGGEATQVNLENDRIEVEGTLNTAVTRQGGAPVASHNFLLEKERQVLTSMAAKYELPMSRFSSYMYTFVRRGEEQLVLLGHPPQDLIEQALRLPGLPARLMINQDEMHDAPKSYDVWPYKGEPKRFDIKVPLDQALKQMGVTG